MTEFDFTDAIDKAITEYESGLLNSNEFRTSIRNTLTATRADAVPCNLNDYRDKAHAMAKRKGFHDVPNQLGTLLMLTVSELSECIEADRANRYGPLDQNKLRELLEVNDDQLFIEEFKHSYKDTVPSEIADAVIRLFDLSGAFNLDLEAHVNAKMRYNALRPTRHGKAY